jgi:hypothetical protein
VNKLHKYFGSVSAGVLTLFKVTTGGDDWVNIHDVVNHLGPFYDALFIVFVGTYFLAFLNVVTATFCEKAMTLAVPTTMELSQARINKEYADAQELFELLTRVLDDEGSHRISRHRFDDFMSHPEVEIYFEVRGLKSTSAHRLFKTLCEVQDTDTLDFATFISACVKLDGTASTIDMHCQSVRALHLHHKLSCMTKELHEETKDIHCILQKQVSDMVAKIKHISESVTRRNDALSL